ncbi:unnamed protein product [Bursaphelenchus okinawaensis]|uniref:PCI domain-containing protein n=1 Tax=Bursaphelenchus okinawaensis TaxID=465554 RepID=A0A811L7Q6_9BILA|nr:unnamed protein product [Bursaphelenchus okinawaensis]CAG9118619.1 unnamed protein product [Bursaphelenchus okinawaensis]
MDEEYFVVRGNLDDLQSLEANVPNFDEEDPEPARNDFDMQIDNPEEVHGKEAPEVLVYRPQVDLDMIVASFTSEALIIRLMFIADVCPPLRAQAFKILLEHIKNKTQNVNAYTHIYHKIDIFKRKNALSDSEIIPPPDQHWLDTTTNKAQARLDLLNTEFRHQKDDGVKESIRRAMDDVFKHHLSMGNVQDALKLYARGIREYCTAPNFLIQMLLNWIDASVYAGQWAKLNVLIPQAERAVAETVERENGPTHTRTIRSREAEGNKKLIQVSKTKLNAVSGLTAMQTGKFKEAANKFMQVDLDSLEYPELLSNHDIAAYGTVTSLATYERSELKEKVLGSASFRKFLESEPKFVNLLQKFTSNQFGVALDILNDIKDGLLLNVYLAPMLDELYALIRKRAIIQYFEPYYSADLKGMAVEFRTSVEELEMELVYLIKSKELSGRIDNYNKILHLKIGNKQNEIFDKILKTNADLEETVHAIILRSALQQQGVFIGNEGNRGGYRRQQGFEDFDGHQNPSASTGHRVLASVQRFFNAASNRIHPQAPENAMDEEHDDDVDENMEN